MKSILVSIVAVVLLAGCGASEAERAMIGAAWKGDIEAIKQHLAAGADVNASDSAGNTALSKASSRGNVEMAKYLISKGADVNAKSTLFIINPITGKSARSYRSVLDCATNKETIDLLSKHGAKTGEELDYR
jgi:ankyrin repeat protein